jgi:peptide/nickel transport system permease protein|tara:strand:+ start:709 stop:1713 length:1005 start_codon:yes stop_codon:yes gene_type:complete
MSKLHPIISTLLKRIGLGIISLFFVTLIIFSSVNLLPGDFVESVLGQTRTEESVKIFRKELGLDKPYHVRYVNWLTSAIQGDLGSTFSGRNATYANQPQQNTARSVSSLLKPRLFNTFFLAAMTAIIAIPLSLILGITAALFRNSIYDRTVNASALTTISMPEFFVAYILIIYLASINQFFPSLSNVTSSTPFFERIYLSVLPALTLTLVTVAHMMRMTRASIINLLSSPYIEMARLKGISKTQVIIKHALPNAWAPIANIIAFNLAYLIVGVVVVEVVFVYPGIGQLMVDSVIKRDIPVVQGCALVFAVTYILLNLIADVISIITNPRLLYPK